MLVKHLAASIMLTGLLTHGIAQAEVWGLKCSVVNVLRLEVPPQTLAPPQTHLFKFDEHGISFTDVGPVKLNGVEIDVDALAISSGSGLLAFQMQTTGSTLIAINSTSAAATTIGSELPGRRIRGATFDLTGRLWAVDVASDQLLEINPGTGSVIGTPLPLTLNAASFDVHAFVTDLCVRCDGTMLLSSHDEPVTTDNIYKVNVASGALTLVGTIPGVANPGMTFSKDSPNPDLMFGFEVQSCDDLYGYDVATCYTRSSIFLNIIPLYFDCPGADFNPDGFNSGPGDLAALMAASVNCTARDLGADCNNNGRPDCLDMGAGGSPDCNGNGTVDCIDISNGAAADCNGNGRPDSCDLANATSSDVNGNGRPDECEDPSTLAADLCNLIRAIPLTAFNGPNANANEGRRTSMANRVCQASSRIANGHVPAAVALLETVLQQVDDLHQPPDWMNPSTHKASLKTKIQQLLNILN